jgi:hypothetical protein
MAASRQREALQVHCALQLILFLLHVSILASPPPPISLQQGTIFLP